MNGLKILGGILVLFGLAGFQNGANPVVGVVFLALGAYLVYKGWAFDEEAGKAKTSSVGLGVNKMPSASAEAAPVANLDPVKQS